MIKIADTDGSGVVEFQEFMEMICDQVEVNKTKFFRLCLAERIERLERDIKES